MTERSSNPPLMLNEAERPLAAVSLAAGCAAFLSAAACCVIPAALALAGLGAGGFAFVVPFHWPLTIASGVAVATGWALHARKRRMCSDAGCADEAPSRATLLLLGGATLFVLLSVAWKAFFEAPLQAWILSL